METKPTRKEARMVHAMIRMTISSDKLAEASRILMSVAERTRLKPGCVNCWIYQDFEDKQVVMIDDFWQTMEDLELHLGSEDYLKILLVVEMATEKPEIRFNTILNSAGVDYIKRAREKPSRRLQP
jgi:quinol monooxygenase YgiN